MVAELATEAGRGAILVTEESDVAGTATRAEAPAPLRTEFCVPEGASGNDESGEAGCDETGDDETGEEGAAKGCKEDGCEATGAEAGREIGCAATRGAAL